jgi:hypothetical protein
MAMWGGGVPLAAAPPDFAGGSLRYPLSGVPPRTPGGFLQTAVCMGSQGRDPAPPWPPSGQRCGAAPLESRTRGDRCLRSANMFHTHLPCSANGPGWRPSVNAVPPGPPDIAAWCRFALGPAALALSEFVAWQFALAGPRSRRVGCPWRKVFVATTASNWATAAWSQGCTARRRGKAVSEFVFAPADRRGGSMARVRSTDRGDEGAQRVAAAQRRRPNSVVTDFGGYEKGIPVSTMP